MGCACGKEEATANGREGPRCYRARLGSLGMTTRERLPEAVSIAEYRRKGMDADATRRWNRRLDRYRTARADGIQPATTRTQDIDRALAVSDALQQPFSATSEAAGG